MRPEHPGSYKGPCQQGIFGLKSWAIPLQRPQCLVGMKTEFKDWIPNQNLILKYKYDSNAASPLGKELTVKLKEIVQFISRHDQHWIKVRNTQNEEGYIPGNYVMSSPDAVKSLPWIEKANEESKGKQKAANYKKYRSAYGPQESSIVEDDESQYYCRVCNKRLNGPIPYKVHLISKAHKEELENQAS